MKNLNLKKLTIAKLAVDQFSKIHGGGDSDDINCNPGKSYIVGGVLVCKNDPPNNGNG
ncbi:hypothetical protein [uncultured Dokdonia sp.]|uniref:hypothetical protein n=1 Tax=uncultured Dokdonia sp. TaxID=575653 RepID=UPI00260E64D2|nr:hypothetical protein [uncultured Dokdonia sp.]